MPLELEQIFGALQMRDWYVFSGLVLTLFLQAVRKTPRFREAWRKLPEGSRWLVPLVMGAAAGFVAAYQSGASLRAALIAAAGGALGIGLPAMGAHAAVKDSPLKIDGGAGGAKPPALREPVYVRFITKDDDDARDDH